MPPFLLWAGGGEILPAAEAQTVGQPHRNFREIQTGNRYFQKKQIAMRCTSRRRIMQQMDSLGRDQRQSAGENAPSGRGNSQIRRRNAGQ